MKTLSKLILPAFLVFQTACIHTQKQYYDSGNVKQLNITRSFSLRTCHDCGKRYTHIEKNTLRTAS